MAITKSSNDDLLFFNGYYYIGIFNSKEGGQIWRTADGEKWEMVIDKGFENTNGGFFNPGIIYK